MLEQKQESLVAPSSLLHPEDVILLLTDLQAGQSFIAQSLDHQTLLNNAVALAKTARAFQVPVVLTTSSTRKFSGPLFPEVQAVFPDQTPLERTSMNSFEDAAVVGAIEQSGRKKVILAGLLTEACLAFSALTALETGYETYAVLDASAGSTVMAHETAVLRMVQAGIKPLTWLQLLLEFQRDWSHSATYASAVAVVKEHAGAYGIGLNYAKAVITD